MLTVLLSRLRRRAQRRTLGYCTAGGCAVLAAIGSPASAAAAESEPPIQAIGASYRLELRVDAGFLGVLSHRYQKGRDGTNFDFREDGAQDVLFPVSRYAASLVLSRRHRLTLVYQPLTLRTREILDRAVVIDGTTFEAGTNLELVYGFPFWRAGYAYSLDVGSRSALRLGVALQIRNATVEFASLDGATFTSNRDVGPVPLLHVGWRTALAHPYWFELEVDGLYAPVKYLNGDDNSVEGAVVDANVRLGIEAFEHADVFVNARYFGGGAEGNSGEAPRTYSSNWLHLAVVSLGVALH